MTVSPSENGGGGDRFTVLTGSQGMTVSPWITPIIHRVFHRSVSERAYYLRGPSWRAEGFIPTEGRLVGRTTTPPAITFTFRPG